MPTQHKPITDYPDAWLQWKPERRGTPPDSAASASDRRTDDGLVSKEIVRTMSTENNFAKIFDGLNDGAMIGNPAYNMKVVAATYPTETKEWNSQTAAAYRQYAMKRMEEQVKASGVAWIQPY